MTTLANTLRHEIYGQIGGVDAREVALQAVGEVGPSRVLEVGCGEGELAERIVSELGVELVAIDQSERMVELALARGIDARAGDVRELPFADGSFDVAVAALKALAPETPLPVTMKS